MLFQRHLPELAADLVATLPDLYGDQLARHCQNDFSRPPPASDDPGAEQVDQIFEFVPGTSVSA
eukprot:SAG31_NODE_59_length_29571_cov_20.443506_14_plen_64_part_00